MNRRVVILSFIYDSFANFSARWYMISSMVGVHFHMESLSRSVAFWIRAFKAMETALNFLLDFFFCDSFFFGNDFQIFINRVCVFIIHSVVVNPF